MKLSLLEFFGSMRPEGPSGKNMHQFPHHGLFSKMGGKPKTNNNFPYEDKDSDLENGDAAAEEEEYKLSEFFKFTVSPSDNTSFHRPPTYGTGHSSAYGKDSKAFGTYDPTSDEEELEDDEVKRKKINSLKGRDFQKVTKIQENPQMRSRHPRDDGDYITKQPYASGMPGYDKKDIVNGEERIDAFMRELEREKSLKEWFDSDFNRLMGSKKAMHPKSDLSFWDIIKRDSPHLITNFEEKEEDEED